jgi:hypothetical protein
MDKYQPYNHPSAWKVSDLDGKAGISEPLGDEHVAAFDIALRQVRANGITVENITRTDFPLDSIAGSVARWENEIQEGRGILVLTGFPADRYSKEECGIIFYGLGAHFGEAQSQSLLGDRLGHVVDVGGKDTRERAYRNSAELALHTDASDIVGMMSLVKAMHGGVSGFCSGPAVYTHILENQPDLLDTLFEGYFYHLFGEQEPGKSPITDKKIPVFSQSEGYLSVSFLRSYIELAFEELEQEKSELETRALDSFDEIAHSPAFRLDFMMEPGDMAFFNNYTVLHTRTEFNDDEDPQRKRHLLRLWLRAWNPRPLCGDIGTYKARKGIDRQKGRGTYYTGKKDYVESTPRHK